MIQPNQSKFDYFSSKNKQTILFCVRHETAQQDTSWLSFYYSETENFLFLLGLCHTTSVTQI